VIADEDEVVGGGRAHILGDPPPLKVFLVPGMGLPDSFRKYRFLVREIKNTIIRYTMSGWMNTFSVLVIVEDVPEKPTVIHHVCLTESVTHVRFSRTRKCMLHHAGKNTSSECRLGKK
jgi:hypothetical protein